MFVMYESLIWKQSLWQIKRNKQKRGLFIILVSDMYGLVNFELIPTFQNATNDLSYMKLLVSSQGWQKT